MCDIKMDQQDLQDQQKQPNQYIVDPVAIETGSMAIISQELTDHYGPISFESPAHEAIVKRVIHTSADFDYYKNLVFSHGVCASLSAALSAGDLTIYTDTQMVLSGMNKRVLGRLGVPVVCLVAEAEVFALAKERGITRSMAAVDFAMARPGKKLFVFGNAPTAVFRVLEFWDGASENERHDIVGVVGVPVGFVGAQESKLALAQSPVPHIAALGRKGGSNVAAAIVNALLYQLTENRE